MIQYMIIIGLFRINILLYLNLINKYIEFIYIYIYIKDIRFKSFYFIFYNLFIFVSFLSNDSKKISKCIFEEVN